MHRIVISHNKRILIFIHHTAMSLHRLFVMGELLGFTSRLKIIYFILSKHFDFNLWILCLLANSKWDLMGIVRSWLISWLAILIYIYVHHNSHLSWQCRVLLENFILSVGLFRLEITRNHPLLRFAIHHRLFLLNKSVEMIEIILCTSYFLINFLVCSDVRGGNLSLYRERIWHLFSRVMLFHI